jgi:UDP-N-acetylmuramoylalanine--D-glutamate ligase
MRPALAGRKVAVFGLGKSGRAAIQLLRREHAQVTAVDQASAADLGETAGALERDGVRLCLGGGDPSGVLRAVDLVVVSPGVPLTLPPIEAARSAGVAVWGEVELAWRFLPRAPFIGITGTNGKSTTTALCGTLFQAAGKRAFAGGNLGSPLSEAALAEQPFDACVVELSSFQLEGAETLRCTGAAILNLTPDHLDRYASHGAYGEAKARIFRNQGDGDFAVVNADDAGVMALARRVAVPVHGFTLAGEGKRGLGGRAVAETEGFRIEPAAGAAERFRVRNRALRGAHNLQNAMAAGLLALHSGVSAEAIQKGLDAYPGLPHRIESVATIDGVEWVNDSKATNVDSSLVALKAFPGNVWLILGGKGKAAPYAPLVEASRGKLKGVLTIGQDAPAIERAFQTEFPVYPCGTLEGAVDSARELARPGDVVLLSPACASFDQFRSFEHRGDTFKALVRERGTR